MRTLGIGNIGNANHDYDYINKFIDMLERIVEIIMKLFSGLGGSKPEEKPKDDGTPEENGKA